MSWLALNVTGGCTDSHQSFQLPPVAPDASTPQAPTAPASALPSARPEALTIVRIVPDTGPYAGGNDAMVRGSGFTEDAVVTVGGHRVQPTDTKLIDSHRLSIVVPANKVGPADVVVTQAGDSARLRDAYTYNALLIEPSSASTAGGTVVEILGRNTSFSQGDSVRFGERFCSDVQVITSTRLRCRTPPHPKGRVDVTVLTRALAPASQTNGSANPRPAEPLRAARAFEYFDPSDTFSSGLSGGPIEGAINVTVVDSFAGLPVPGALVMVGSKRSTHLKGLTDANGQIVLSEAGLRGPRSVHAAKKCFERSSFVAMDARNVTMYLRPQADPRCGKPNLGGGQAAAGAFISGRLIWRTRDEFHETPWAMVPEPRPSEQRVAYVFTTRSRRNVPNPNPAAGGSRNRIGESQGGVPDHSYRLFARPAALAVYALAGLEDARTQEFVPYVMGVARNVVAGPGEQIDEVDIHMDIALDTFLDVELAELPARAARGPDAFEVEAHIDLGGEGVIVRRVNGTYLDRIERRGSGSVFRFWAQPHFHRDLADALYYVEGAWYSDTTRQLPSTATIRRAVKAQNGRITLGGFLGVPQNMVPVHGSLLPRDRVLRWVADGAPADLHQVTVTGGDGLPAWRLLIPGNVQEAPLPDLSKLPLAPALPDIPEGTIVWRVQSFRTPGFDFNTFRYSILSTRYITHLAVDAFTARR